MSRRRIPTKAELLRLQKLYRTDKRIAETLGGGVTEHLVAYWRRKKGVPKYNFPKFSEKEIQDVWDRFGDDFHAGMELGISKAAFYNWRRRYKITKKPEALKLEQLSLELFTQDKRGKIRTGNNRQTVIQKVLARFVSGNEVVVGSSIEIEPDLLLTCLHSVDAVQRFKESGHAYVWNPSRIVIALDGDILFHSKETNADAVKQVRDFARLQKIHHFYDIGFGSPCQVVVERGMALPGAIILGCGAQVLSLGAIGAVVLSLPLDEIAQVWTSGKYVVSVPDTIRINVAGRIPGALSAKDIAYYIIQQIHAEKLSHVAVEFYGSAIEQMSIAERLTLCALIQNTGAVSAICPYDATTRRYCNSKAKKPFAPVLADRNAVYLEEYTFNANTMKPLIAEFDDDIRIKPVDELNGIPIQSVFIGGAVNGRFEDLKIAVEILKSGKVSPGIRLFIQPATQEAFLESVKKGLIRVFLENGAIILTPGFPFDFSESFFLAVGEKAVSTDCAFLSTPNSGKLFFTSPATAAASAITGRLTNPSAYIKA